MRPLRSVSVARSETPWGSTRRSWLRNDAMAARSVGLTTPAAAGCQLGDSPSGDSEHGGHVRHAKAHLPKGRSELTQVLSGVTLRLRGLGGLVLHLVHLVLYAA